MRLFAFTAKTFLLLLQAADFRFRSQTRFVLLEPRVAIFFGRRELAIGRRVVKPQLPIARLQVQADDLARKTFLQAANGVVLAVPQSEPWSRGVRRSAKGSKRKYSCTFSRSR
jgi:hypothetical protein